MILLEKTHCKQKQCIPDLYTMYANVCSNKKKKVNLLAHIKCDSVPFGSTLKAVQ